MADNAGTKKSKNDDGYLKNVNRPPSERVEQWLQSRGTPLEFQTAVAFSAASFHVEQGLHEKQQEGNPLEIDVLAASRRAVSSRGVMGIDVVVECKYAPTPWVAFSPLDATTSDKGTAASAQPIESTTMEVARRLRTHEHGVELNPWPADAIAFGLTATRGGDPSQKDNAYEALTGVVSRARLRRARLESTRWHTRQLPLIVIGGDLCMAAWHRETSKIAVREIPSCIVEFRGDTELPTVQVQVVTFAALPAFVKALEQHVRSQLGWLESWVDTIERALSRESLGDVGLNTEIPEHEELHAKLGQVLMRRQAVQLATKLGG